MVFSGTVDKVEASLYYINMLYFETIVYFLALLFYLFLLHPCCDIVWIVVCAFSLLQSWNDVLLMMSHVERRKESGHIIQNGCKKRQI